MNETGGKAKIAAKVRALLSKKVQNGCTEQEALDAARKAAELMREYQLAASDVELLEDGFAENFIGDKRKDEFPAYSDLAGTIARLTGTEAIAHRDREHGARISFFGLKADADFALWLCSSLGDFILAGCSRFIIEQKAAAPMNGRSTAAMWKRSYITGATIRIAERLAELADAQESALRAPSASKSLVVRGKHDLVAEELARRGVRLTQGRGRTVTIDQSAFESGIARGEAAEFDRPIEAGEDRAQLTADA